VIFNQFLLISIGGKNSQKNYCVTPAESLQYTNELFAMIHKGTIKVNIHKEYPFTAEGVVTSQQDLTDGKTTGKLLIRLADE